MIDFDDGNLSVYSTAYPILSQYGFTANAYMITNKAASAGYISITNMTTMYNNGWDIASHGYSHTDLTTLTAAEQEAEISDAQENLTAWGFTRSANHLAYRGGAYNADAIQSAKNVGVLTARATYSGTTILPNITLYEMPIEDAVTNAKPVATVTGLVTGTTNQTIRILFHSINADTATYSWSEAKFSEFAKWLSDNGYQTITISEWYALNAAAGGVEPVASFTATSSGATVTFTDQSTNTPTSWTWQYNQHEAPGWVQFSTSQNPSYNFV
jgi:peptidoglycan/xylan/chitin deacetylase (PgdA/CDA1 family)